MTRQVPSAFVLSQLRMMVGDAGYYDSPADIEPFLVDHRRLYRGATPLVLRPNTTAQVSQILKLCNEHRIGVVPVGGNTGYCGGATPAADGSQVVVSLARLKRIRSIDSLNYTLTVEAGCVLAEVQRAAAQHERLFPLSLGSEGSCHIGGNLATNAGGTSVFRYGMARELALGLEVVLPDGRVLDDLSGLRKNNTGYDLRDLFIGAEGTLGIITAATLKLYPMPRSRVTALIAVHEPAAAVELLSIMRSASSDSLATFELMPRAALELVMQHIQGVSDPLQQAYPWYVLLEATSAQTGTALNDDIAIALAAAQESGVIRDATLAHTEAQHEMLWRIRESISEAQTRAGGSIKHDVAVTISDIPRFIAAGVTLCKRLAPEGVMVVYGHLGDGSLHFNINAPPQATVAQRAAFFAKTEELNQAMHDLTQAYRGSISAEHGIGQLKRDALARYKHPVALDIMRAIKRSLDPHDIMNPGKLISF
jgi:FAD/FMN-containing dehydrogenase